MPAIPGSARGRFPRTHARIGPLNRGTFPLTRLRGRSRFGAAKARPLPTVGATLSPRTRGYVFSARSAGGPRPQRVGAHDPLKFDRAGASMEPLRPETGRAPGATIAEGSNARFRSGVSALESSALG